MICPIHKFRNEDECSLCEVAGVKVVECELDKRIRVEDTLEQQGYMLDYRRSFVRLVFVKEK